MNICDFKKTRLIDDAEKIFLEDKTYAIILSSPSLLESKNGDFINSHDYVIRFNFAPTGNFEKYVGSKTTHRFLGGVRGASTYYKEPQDMNIIRWVIGNGCKKQHDDSLKYIQQDLKNYKKYPEFFNNFYYMACDNYVKHNCYKYNAGYKILSSIKYVNRHVNIFGYRDNKKYDKYHYYDDKNNMMNALKIMHKYSLDDVNPWEDVVRSASIQKAYKNHPYEDTDILIKKLSSERKINII